MPMYYNLFHVQEYQHDVQLNWLTMGSLEATTATERDKTKRLNWKNKVPARAF